MRVTRVLWLLLTTLMPRVSPMSCVVSPMSALELARETETTREKRRLLVRSLALCTLFLTRGQAFPFLSIPFFGVRVASLFEDYSCYSGLVYSVPVRIGAGERNGDYSRETETTRVSLALCTLFLTSGQAYPFSSITLFGVRVASLFEDYACYSGLVYSSPQLL